MTHQLRAIMASQTNIFVNDTISFALQNFKAWCINAPRQAKLKGARRSHNTTTKQPLAKKSNPKPAKASQRS
jgi:hypothetical protein